MAKKHDYVGEDGSIKDPTGKLPPALAKALYDNFDYMMGLRDGRVIRFERAELCEGEKWVRLGVPDYTGGARCNIEMSGVEHSFPRGVEVRIRDIVWVADAPDGS